MVVMRDVQISEYTPDHIEVGIDGFVEKRTFKRAKGQLNRQKPS